MIRIPFLDTLLEHVLGLHTFEKIQDDMKVVCTKLQTNLLISNRNGNDKNYTEQSETTIGKETESEFEFKTRKSNN